MIASVRSFTVWLLCAAALALGGCASVPEHRAAKLETPSDGAVLVRVLPNTQSVSQFFKAWQSLTVAREKTAGEAEEAKFTIAPTMDAASRSALYAGALPPGVYRFVQFSSQQCGYMCVNSWLSVNPQFSKFEIKAGQLTDLGVLVQSSSAIGGNRSVMMSHDSKPKTDATPEFVRELTPGLGGLLNQPILSWLARDRAPGFAMDLLATMARQQSFGLASPREVDDGAFIHGSANGMVFLWKPGQRRQGFDIGERVAVDSVLATTNGLWLAGGEYGVLKASRDQGKTWSSLRGNLPFALILDLHEWQGQVLVTMLRGNDVSVHATASGSDSWQVVARYTMDLSTFWDVPGVRPQSFLLGDRLVTTLPGRKLAVLDLTNRRTETHALPGAVQMFSASADGVLRCRCVSTIAVNPYESHDMGKTWKESTASRFMLMPAFRDKQFGVAFKGGFMAPSKMAYTQDGGQTWVETTEAPVPFQQLFWARDGKAAYAASAQGQMWVTRDDGKTWSAMPR